MLLYIALVHYPVYNKNRDTIASAITTLDIHDISRIARTYSAKAFFVITPLWDQKELVGKIKAHWTQGYGAVYNPDRKEAIELVWIVDSLEQAKQEIEKAEGEPPVCIATDASESVGNIIRFDNAREVVDQNRPVLLFFGTAWGLHKHVLQEADYVLEPVSGASEYNHLPVRAAAAIVLDRLVGR